MDDRVQFNEAVVSEKDVNFRIVVVCTEPEEDSEVVENSVDSYFRNPSYNGSTIDTTSTSRTFNQLYSLDSDGPECLVLDDSASISPGSIQLRSDYTSVQSLTGSGTEYSALRLNRNSPRDSRSGTPIHGETSGASLNVRRTGSHGGSRNRKKETISTEKSATYIGDQYDNLEDLVSYIQGDTKKTAQAVAKKTKKKGKRKETLSKSHSLDENTLGTDVNPSMEARSVSSTLLENNSDEKQASVHTAELLDLSPSSSKYDSSRHSSVSTDFIPVTNKKKKGPRTNDSNKLKDDNGRDGPAFVPVPFKVETAPKLETPVKEVIVPKLEPIFKAELVQKRETVWKQDIPVKKEVPIVPKEASTTKFEPALKPELTYTAHNPKDHGRPDPLKRQDSGRKHETIQRKCPEPQRKLDSFTGTAGAGSVGRRPDIMRRQDSGRRKEPSPKDELPLSFDTSTPRRPHQVARHDSEPKPNTSFSPEFVPKSNSMPIVESIQDPIPIKSQDAVKFCGVNFENKAEILVKPNVEFGFGVADVLTHLATAAPSEVANVDTNTVAKSREPTKQQKSNNVSHRTSPVAESPITQPVIPGEVSHVRTVEIQSQQAGSKMQPTVVDKESLLGRHPQVSSPMHYIPMSISLPISGPGYPLSASSFYPPIQPQVPVGVMQYFPTQHIQQIQQGSTSIMAALPNQGATNIQQSFMSPLSLNLQQHQLIQHQQQLIQHPPQQPQPTPPFNTIQQQQPMLQYQQVLLKPSPTQPQYTGTQPTLPPFSPAQGSVPPHPQQGFTSPGQPSGNYNFHRSSTTPRSNHNIINPSMSGFPVSPQQPQFGPNPHQYVTSTSSHHNFSPQGPPAGVQYNAYHRSNSRSTHLSNASGHGYSHQQPSPSQVHNSGQIATAQHFHHNSGNQTQQSRSLNPVSQNPPLNADSAEKSASPVLDGYVVVNSETNPIGQYYTPPPENEDHLKLARAGQEYMNKYVEKLNEKGDKGTTVHRV